jgi:hypothetical protein
MKTTIADQQLDILGNGEHPSDHEVLSTLLKQWRKRLGYFSIFAAVPALVAVPVSEARTDEPKEPDANVSRRIQQRLNKLGLRTNTPALLKRQSEFRLPHQRGNFATLASVAGNDGCPGQRIPGGTYTATSPYLDSGDTTGANNTVNHVQYYYYYSFDAGGPDHVYSFTLTGRGQFPQIQVSTTSSSYKPMIYVLPGGFSGSCPAGTQNNAYA